jgi:Fe-S-cluster containining protein
MTTKHCFNCQVAIKPGICKGDCCGCVPISNSVFELHKKKITREIDKHLDWGDGLFIPLTSDGMCCFLQADYSCGIYEDRPSVCKEYGTTEANIHLACPHLKPSGSLRSAASIKKICRAQNKATNFKLNKLLN